MCVFFLEPVEIGQRCVDFDDSLGKPLFDQRLGKFGGEAQEQ